MGNATGQMTTGGTDVGEKKFKETSTKCNVGMLFGSGFEPTNCKKTLIIGKLEQ